MVRKWRQGVDELGTGIPRNSEDDVETLKIEIK